MQLLLLLPCLTLAAAATSQEADHADCVDISYYSDVEFNSTDAQLCSYKVRRQCTPHSERVCRSVPVYTCRVDTHTVCEETKKTQVVREDNLENRYFTEKVCEPGPIEVLEEIKQMPVCETVTKQQCDSKWEVDPLTGEKVWAGNENCREVSWEDCRLQDTPVTQEVPTWTCRDGDTQTYQVRTLISQPIIERNAEQSIGLDSHTMTDNCCAQVVVAGEYEVETVERVCRAEACPTCDVTHTTECETLEWEDCTEHIEPNCFLSAFRVPFQEYNHLLRCPIH